MTNSNNQTPLLSVKNLQTWFGSANNPVRAVDGVSFDILKGETFALLGESGCGKSITSLSIMRLVPEPAGNIVAGSVMLHDQDLLQLPEVQMRDVRGRRIAMIFQEPMTSLNPVMTVGNQIKESVTRHMRWSASSADKRVLELLDAVGIPDPKRRVNEYPHQMSGGMKQRVMIAMALAGEPELLIADEPTTALDVTIQSQVLELIRKLQSDTGMSILLITHDLGVVAEVADRVAVMYAGQIVEQADRDTFFNNARHPYSRKLFDSVPTLAKRGQSLAVIKGSVPSLSTKFSGCRFESRCEYAWDLCRTTVPSWIAEENNQGVLCHLADPNYRDQAPTSPTQSADTMQVRDKVSDEKYEPQQLLHVENLKVHFPVTKGLFKRTVGHVKAVDGVTINIPQGRTLALVGESGCGKTTVGKGILQLVRPTGGLVQLGKLELTQLSSSALRTARGDIQIIFQDPFSSMNPRMMISDIIEEGMIAQNIGSNEQERQKRIDELLDQVGLNPDIKRRYPHEFSGGQRQRICIARALAVDPKLIICDEPTSALDVSVQAQILNLLKRLQDNLKLTFLFITHDLSVVEYLAHEVAVMYLGRIVEQGSVEEVLQQPKHPYTKALLSAVPTIEQDSERTVIRLRGEIPSPINPPIGCHFNPRCAHAVQICRNRYPEPTKISETHFVRCVLYD